ncbi:MAG: hypothetical protein Q7J98_11610 [Kiritimatiellia bacterium]|nr:hypothetical protein [Kiritimatiellia bacterium]
MNDEIRKNLVDILQAAEEIQGFTHGLDLKAYQNSPSYKEQWSGILRLLEKPLTGLRKLMTHFLKGSLNIAASSDSGTS